MLRISKLTDYATVILARLAAAARAALHRRAAGRRDPPGRRRPSPSCSSSCIGAAWSAPRAACAAAIVLARPAAEITAAQILDALEGPVALTECAGTRSHCSIESTCGVGRAWQRVNLAIRRSLQEITLLELAGLRRQRRCALPRSSAQLRAGADGTLMSSTPNFDALVNRSYRARLRHRHRVGHGCRRAGRDRWCG